MGNCTSCGGGPRNALGHRVNAQGVAEAIRLTYDDGAQVFYQDINRAISDHSQLPGTTLERVDPVTNAVLEDLTGKTAA